MARMLWLLQTLLLGCAVVLALWVGTPGMAVAGLVALWLALVVPQAVPAPKRESWVRLLAVWVGSLIVCLSAASKSFTFDSYYAMPAWLIAASVWLTQRRVADAAARARWKTPVLAWLFCGALMLLAGGYVQDRPGDFFGGLLATVALLALWRAWFQPRAAVAQMINTLILLLVGLPVADLLVHFLPRPALRPDTCRLYYSYNAAKGDPEAAGSRHL
jgi:hypothetical protein